MLEVRDILVDRSPGETRIALVDDEDALLELHVERDHAPSRVGEIVLGRVTGVTRTSEAAFLDIGGGEGFLKLRGHADLHEGQAVLVQVAADPTGDKAARVTREIDLHGRYVTLNWHHGGHSVSSRISSRAERNRLRRILVETVPGAIGAIARKRAEGVADDAIRADALELVRQREDLADHTAKAAAPTTLRQREDAISRLHHLHPDLPVARGEEGALFAKHGLEEQIEEALSRVVPVGEKGRLTIDELEALTAIDVDTGRDTSGGAVEMRRFNEAAAEAIARQIRLRALGGLIVIDFPRLVAKPDRAKVFEAIQAALENDPDTPTLHGWTKAGLFEISRRRRGPSLRQQLMAPAQPARASAETVALGALRSALRLGRGKPHTVIACPDSIAAALRGPLAPAFAEARRKLGGQLEIRAIPGYEGDRIDILEG